jgi:Type I phosphodiesterase / nucleotide pyrophosphatase
MTFSFSSLHHVSRSTLVACCLWGTVGLTSGTSHAEPPRSSSPRLIVVISVDQLCADYLIRFQDNFSPDTRESIFRAILENGAWFSNCHHAHAFTFTAPGHAVLLTGAYPCTNGMVENEWYDRTSRKTQYCVSDPSVDVIGVASDESMSPRSLLVDTVGDALKLATGGKAKVIGVAIKDRAAILLSGHRADAAYWLEENQWVTTTYYRKDLPGYLRILNEGKAIDQFHSKTWDLLLPRERYHNQGDDDNEFENPPEGFSAAFPHVLAKAGELKPDKFGDQVLFSPFGNDYTLLAAREIIVGEQMGADDIPDLLTINLSSNDYVGHAFGPFSFEVEDMTYRTDRQLAGFAQYLDEQIGVGRWTLAITSDHGVAPIPEWVAQHADSGMQSLAGKRNPLGDLKLVRGRLEAMLRHEFGLDEDEAPKADDKFILDLDANQVYLNHEHPELRGQRLVDAQQMVQEWLVGQPYVAGAATREELLGGGSARLLEQLRLSFHPGRSGDILFVYTPYAIPASTSANAKPKGTTHGSPWHYDTHVPLLLLGNGIIPGQYTERVSPAQLAPTISRLFGTNAPGGCVVEAIDQVITPRPGY